MNKHWITTAHGRKQIVRRAGTGGEYYQEVNGGWWVRTMAGDYVPVPLSSRALLAALAAEAPAPRMTDEQIETLRLEALAAGDRALWALCMLALGRTTIEGAEHPTAAVQTAARADCDRAVRTAHASCEE